MQDPELMSLSPQDAMCDCVVSPEYAGRNVYLSLLLGETTDILLSSDWGVANETPGHSGATQEIVESWPGISAWLQAYPPRKKTD